MTGPGAVEAAEAEVAEAATGAAGRLALVTGATGYIGGRLVPELLEAGYRVRAWPAARRPARPRLVRRRRGRRGRRSTPASLRAGARRRRRRLLPAALASARGGDFARDRPRHGARLRQAAAAAGVGRHRLPRRPGPRRRRSCPRTCGSRREVGRHPARPRGVPTTVLRAGRDHRLGLGVVRDAALPHRAAARDDHAALGPQPDPADRGPRRAALPRRLRRRCPPTSTAPSTSAAPTS